MRVNHDWLVHVPFAKAVAAEDGRLIIEGIASDESLDLENEIVKGSGLLGTIDLLEERGVLNWDHGNVNIGRVLVAKSIPRAEAEERFPELKQWFDREFVGDRMFYIKAAIDPPPPEGEPVPADLVNARLGVINGHRLGFSLQGGRVVRSESKGPDGHIYPSTEQSVITKVAVCSCPMNQNSLVRLAKSLSAAMADEHTDGVPMVVLAKSVTAGGGTDHAAFTGGRALVGESLHGASVDTTIWRCPTCALGRHVPLDDDDPHCATCGTAMVPLHADTPVRKAVGNALDRIDEQLPRSTEGSHIMAAPTQGDLPDDRETAISKGVQMFKQALGMLHKAFEAPDDDDEVDVDINLDGDGDEGDGPPELVDEAGDDDPDAPPGEDELDEILEEIDDLDEDDDGDFAEDEEDEEVSKSVMDRLSQDANLAPVLNADEAFATVLGAFADHIDARFERMEKALVAVAQGNEAMAKSLQAPAPEAPEAPAPEGSAAPAGASYEVVSKGIPGAGSPAAQVQAAQATITKAVRADAISAERSVSLRKRVERGDANALREVAAIEQQLS